MSTLNVKNIQVGNSSTANQNFTLYQPATPDGTVRLGVGNSGATSSDAVVVNNSGNVGIGPVPVSWASNFKGLQVGSNAALWGQSSGMGSTYLSANVYYDGSNRRYLNTGETTEYEQWNGNHLFKRSASGTQGAVVSQVESARIDNSGNLMVGLTSSQFGTAPKIETRVADGRAFGVSNSGTGTATAAMFLNNTGSSVGSISFTTTATTYATSSDYRLKEDIAPMTGALARVTALKPVTYKWKADGSDGEGFIAHELQAVVPDCVTGEKDAVDADGNPVYQGIDTSFLAGLFAAAIQELNAKVEAQAAEIAALKAAA